MYPVCTRLRHNVRCCCRALHPTARSRTRASGANWTPMHEMVARAARFSRVAFAFCLAGCLPIPHRETETPRIVGRLVVNGAPTANIPVILRVTRGDSLCMIVDRRGVTGERGRFEFAPRRSWSLWVFLVLAHRSYDWQVCLGQRSLPAYQATLYTIGDAPTDSLECELTTPGPSASCRGQYGSRNGRRP